MKPQEADYVIVGGGTAGCVLANRLSADGRYHVILLEAGGRDTSPWVHIPLGYGKLASNPRYSIAYQSEPEPELGGRRVGLPRGRVLGGSSTTNGLLYVRGQAEDYDGWAEAGNTGWSFADVLPYFRRAETYHGGASHWHGGDGPIGVSGPAAPHPLAEAFIAAGEQIGIPRNADFNGPVQEGIGYYDMTTRNFRRSSASTAYLRPARKRDNLTVITEAHATRLLFDGGRATGVEYRQGTELLRVRAHREVLVAGGAIGSPHLLMLSGIGAGEALRHLGLPVVADRAAVGQNLVDHANVRLNYRAARPITMNDRLGSWLGQLGAGIEYLVRRTGPLTVSAGFGATFFRTRPELDRPDFQGYLLLFRTDASGAKLEPFSGFMTSGYQLRPESRGAVTLASADPLERPLVRPNYLAAEGDRAATLAGVKRLRAILRAPAMAPLVAEAEPGDDADDATLIAYIRERMSAGHHVAGSCRMGPDEAAVVDPQLRVRGVAGLRVADASIMPSMVSGNTCAPTVMIAEKAADMILADSRA
jgi:choline dehydrogenase